MSLYQEVILLEHFFKGKYCVENVVGYYNPLVTPQKVNRHYYWANFKIPQIELPKMENFSKAKRSDVAKWLGFDYSGDNYYVGNNHDPAQVLRNCMHPDEGKTILETALGIIRKSNPNQLEIPL